MKVKILKEDKVFSQVVRITGKKCARCGSQVQFNEQGLPITHQCSHYWSRGNWNTRFDIENGDVLCFACHRLWGGDDRADYKAYKINQLGIERYKALERRKNEYANKRKILAWAYPYYKQKLKELLNK